MAAAGVAAGAESAGQIVFTASGSWVVPPDVTAISGVAVSTSNAAIGGGLAYSNGIAVTPGETLTISIIGNANGTRLLRGSTVLLRGAVLIANCVGDVRFSGGRGGADFGAGGGAAGYAGNGGDGGTLNSPGTAGSGGSGGGGFGGTATGNAGGGGGVGLLGIGASGVGGDAGNPGGTGGSNGSDGAINRLPGRFGGGGSGTPASAGGLRIIWGAGRSYPNNALDV